MIRSNSGKRPLGRPLVPGRCRRTRNAWDSSISPRPDFGFYPFVFALLGDSQWKESGPFGVGLQACGAGFPACHWKGPEKGRLESLPHMCIVFHPGHDSTLTWIWVDSSSKISYPGLSQQHCPGLVPTEISLLERLMAVVVSSQNNNNLLTQLLDSYIVIMVMEKDYE